MKRWLILGITTLYFAGCTPQPSPQIEKHVAEPEPTPETAQLYLEETPSEDLYIQRDEKSFSLRPISPMTTRQSIVNTAMSYLNKRDGGDCSGFVKLVNLKTGRPYYNEKELNANFDNARKSRAMFNLMAKRGHAFETMLPNLGDLVFFENTERRPAVKTKTKGKNPPKPQPAASVIENITHVGIVTRIDTDGTVEFIHHSNGKNILDYMNFNYPMLTNKDGKKINTYMKRCPSKGGAAQPQCMNIAFFVAYGTF